jgi:hypothetical protein
MQKLNLKNYHWIPKVIVVILVVVLMFIVYQYRVQSEEKITKLTEYSEQMTTLRLEEQARLKKIYTNLEEVIDKNLKGIVCYSENSETDIDVSVALNEQIQNKIVDKLDFSKIVNEEATSLVTVQEYSVEIPVVSQVEVQEELSDYVAVIFLEEEMSYKEIKKKVSELVAENQEYLIVDFVKENPATELQNKYKNHYLNVSDVETKKVASKIYKQIKKLGILDEILEIVDTFN